MKRLKKRRDLPRTKRSTSAGKSSTPRRSMTKAQEQALAAELLELFGPVDDNSLSEKDKQKIKKELDAEFAELEEAARQAMKEIKQDTRHAAKHDSPSTLGVRTRPKRMRTASHAKTKQGTAKRRRRARRGTR